MKIDGRVLRTASQGRLSKLGGRVAQPCSVVRTVEDRPPSRFADLDLPQAFTLRADEILGNERQTV